MTYSQTTLPPVKLRLHETRRHTHCTAVTEKALQESELLYSTVWCNFSTRQGILLEHQKEHINVHCQRSQFYFLIMSQSPP